MRGIRKTTCVLALASAALSATGCQSQGVRRVASTEPGLTTGPVEPGATVVGASPPVGTSVTWIDRHPLFSKPRDYYDNSTSNNKVVKAATATVIGVPAGIIGELRQIVVGNPTEPRAVEYRR
jgi:hypothetical protein